MFDLSLQMLNDYFGPSMHLLLLISAFIFFVLFNKKIKFSKSIICFIVVFAVIYFMPIFSKIIITYCIPENTYWRMLWIIPVPIIVCYMFVQGICILKKKYVRFFCVIISIVIIRITGYNVYGYSLFDKSENIYKLPKDTIEVCNVIKSDTQLYFRKVARVLAPNELVSSIRQYDASIKMPYGRSYVMGGYGITPYWYAVDKNVEGIVKYFKETSCNYLVWPKESKMCDQLLISGFTYVGESTNYYILYNEVELR